MPTRGVRPDPAERDEGAFAYPELRIEYDPESPPPAPARAFARLNQPGIYTTSIARPALFREYLREQLEHLVRDYPVEVSVGTSASEIPYPYVLDGGDLDLDGISTAELSRWFPSTDLVHIGDEVADGAWDVALDPTRPLALFDALAHRLQPGPAQALHRHSGRAFPALRAVHQLCPLRRRVRPLRRRRAARSRQPLHQPVRPRRHVRAWRPRRRRGADRGGRVAAPPDAGLSSDDAGRRRHHPGQHRRRPVQRQDDLRPYRGAAPRSLADDRPLRRPSPQPDDRRLCPRPRLSSRRPCARRRAAGRNPDPGHRRGPDRALQRRAGGHRRGRGQRQEAAAHRHRGHHRRPQLGAALHIVGAALQPEPRGGDRHGIGDRRRPGLPLPRALRDAALRLRQAAPRRTEAARPGQRLLRARDQPAPAHRHRDARISQAGRRRPPQPQAAQLRRAAAALGRWRSPILGRQVGDPAQHRHRRIGREIGFGRVEIEPGVDRIAPAGQHREIVAARGEEIVDRDAIGLRRIDRLAVQRHGHDPLPRRPRLVIAEAEIGRGRQQVGLRRAVQPAGELLLQHRLDLAPRCSSWSRHCWRRAASRKSGRR